MRVPIGPRQGRGRGLVPADSVDLSARMKASTWGPDGPIGEDDNYRLRLDTDRLGGWRLPRTGSSTRMHVWNALIVIHYTEPFQKPE